MNDERQTKRQETLMLLAALVNCQQQPEPVVEE
jgi:hypothetical protein